MGTYYSAIWRCRYFWLSLVRMDLHARYRGSVLGIGWSLMQPLAMTALFTVIFCQLFAQDFRTYPLQVLSGLAFWGYVQTALIQGCRTFFQSELYIRQHPAPLAIYPLRTVLGGGFHLAMALLAALGLSLIAFILGDGSHLQLLSLFSLLPTFLLLLLLGWAMALLAGIAHVFFRDTGHLCEVGLQMWFYLTPIMYPRQLLDQRGLSFLVDLNPFVPFLDLLREPLAFHAVPQVATYLKAVAIVLIMTTTATFVLARLEKKLIFRL